MNFFHLIFPRANNTFFVLRPPRPLPHKFSNGLSLNHTDTDQFAYSSVIVWESVLGAKSCGQPIWLKLSTEVGCDKIFQKPLLLTSLTFSFGVTGGGGGGGSHFFPFEHQKSSLDSACIKMIQLILYQINLGSVGTVPSCHLILLPFRGNFMCFSSVVQTLISSIHRINNYPADRYGGN